VAEAMFVTKFAVQASLPRAVTVAVTVQELSGEMKLVVKFADAPGGKTGTVSTVDGDDWVFTTETLFNVTLPVLLTSPL
jgi:hypothetical protein